MKRHALTEEQWELVEPLIPLGAAKTGRPAMDRPLMLDGIFGTLATGTPWRDCPNALARSRACIGTSRNGVLAVGSPDCLIRALLRIV